LKVIYLAENDLDLTFSALAHPARRAILARLAQGQASVNELAEPFEMSQPAVSKHLKVLERAGLVSRGKDAQWRPSELRAEPLRQASEWIATYREYWEKKLDRLDAYLQKINKKETRNA
jgi:DNA-binding transcriptional ArsR family regulator